MIILYLFVFILGLVIGSFLNVCIYRIPRGESIVNPPSHCTNCGTRLQPPDLVPVLSFLFLKGKCRYCGVKVSPRYAVVELVTALAFTMLFHRYGFSVYFPAAAYLTAILIVVFAIDLEHRIIPNGLVIAGLIGGAALTVYNVFHPVVIYGDRHWWNPLLGIAVGSGFLFVVAVISVFIYKSDEAMGMGDVKIFAPIGIFLGWRMTAVALFLSVVTAGIAGLLLMLKSMKNRKATFPFGPFIALSSYIVLLWGWDILVWYLKRL